MCEQPRSGFLHRLLHAEPSTQLSIRCAHLRQFVCQGEITTVVVSTTGVRSLTDNNDSISPAIVDTITVDTVIVGTTGVHYLTDNNVIVEIVTSAIRCFAGRHRWLIVTHDSPSLDLDSRPSPNPEHVCIRRQAAVRRVMARALTSVT
jgi:hypothetical protein